MREAVIVSTARTPMTKAHRGEFNVTPSTSLTAFAVKAAVDRAGVDPALIEDIIIGCGYPEGRSGRNLGRNSALRAGLPLTIAGATVSRFCASGLMAVASAASRIIVDGAPVMVAGGMESISGLRRPDGTGLETGIDPWLLEHKPDLYMTMIETADVVAQRYNISREAQDQFSLASQQKTAAAQAAGIFKDEIISVDDHHGHHRQGDQGCLLPGSVDRPRHLQPRRHHLRRPGQAGAGARPRPVHHRGQCLAAVGRCLGLRADGQPGSRAPGPATLGAFRGFAVAGCEPDEMGIGPVFAVPELLARHGLSVDDIDLWEVNEAFASQSIYCQQTARHPRRAPERQRRRHLDRPPLRHERRPHGRPRAAGRPSPQGPGPQGRSGPW